MDTFKSNGAMLSQIDLGNVPKSGFDMSFPNGLTGKLGKIIPTRVQEIMPGDRTKGNSTFTVQFEPLAAPPMANMYLKGESFFVPLSQVWKNYDLFFTGKKGYNGNVPSVSVYDIVHCLCSFPILPLYEAGTNSNLGNDAFANACYGCLSALDMKYKNFQAFDLIRPYRDMLVLIRDINYAGANPSSTTPGETNLWVQYFGGSIKTTTTTRSGRQATRSAVRRGNTVSTQTTRQEVTETISATTYSSTGKELFKMFGPKLLDFWFGPSSLFDYLGFCLLDSEEVVNDLLSFPPAGKRTIEQIVSKVPLNWLPVRCAYKVWYHNYRDQLLELDALDPEDYMNDAVQDNEILLMSLLRVRCWSKDIYTTSITTPGDGSLVVPISNDIQWGNQDVNVDTVPVRSTAVDELNYGKAEDFSLTIGSNVYRIPSRYLDINREMASIGSSQNFYFSLSEMDRIKRLQKWVSRRLVLGVEYDDVVYSDWRVKVSNVRLHYPELLESYRTGVSINTVVNNTNNEYNVIGDKGAVAYTSANSDGMNYFAEEHGYILSFMSVMPVGCTPFGVQRKYLRQSRFDFPWPLFAQLGFCAVSNAELEFNGIQNDDQRACSVFGYQGQYYDQKCNQMELHGRFKTDLNYLTFSRKFDISNTAFIDPDSSYPRLNYMFVHCHPNTDMFVTADNSEDVFRCEISHNYAMERMLPVPSELL